MTKNNINFSIAFGGGAARGLAHIGILKYLEEKNLYPSEVSGTSMGSIIASLYALGKTSDEMEKVAAEINYFKLIDIDLKKGLLSGVKIKKFLKELFGEINIESLKIPLKIVSTNINTGEKVVFESGSLVEAIRSSISIPGVIMPNKIGDDEFVDGGIINNLPIEALSGDNIIGVSVLRDIKRPLETKHNLFGIEFKHNLFGMSYQILQKTIDIMMKQNEDRSIKSNKKVIFIHPKFPGIDYYEFHKYKEIIEIGYKEAKDQKIDLQIINNFSK